MSRNAGILSWAETALLLITAVWVRVVLPEALVFGPDQVGFLVEGRAVLNGDWFLLGPGVGWSQFEIGPLCNQMYALGLLFRDEFTDAALLLGTIHGAAVLGWRRALAEMAPAADPRFARIAAWALALHPVSLMSGNAGTHCVFILPTTLVFFWGIVRWVRRSSPSGFAVACVGAAMMVQTHLITVALLPMFLVGLRRKAPIGRTGLAGIAAAFLLMLPMLIHNVPLLISSPQGVRHAGSDAGPLWVAAARAITLEARALQLPASLPDSWVAAGRATGFLWAALMLIGAAAFALRTDDAIAKALVVYGLVVPTLLVLLIPRGAELRYLDQTVPFRTFLFAAGVGALSAIGSRGILRTVARAAAIVAIVVPGGLIVLVRFAAADTGFAKVNASRIDLREQTGLPPQPIGVLTLGSVREIGRALDRLGANAQGIHETWHGPWRWLGAHGVGIWIEESRRERGTRTLEETARDRRAGDESARSFLVLHRLDEGVVPDSTPVEAGRFRVFAFEDRLRVTSAEGDRYEGVVDAAGARPATVQVVTDAATRADRIHLPDGDSATTRTDSPSGFVVWSAPVEVSAPTTIRLGLSQGNLDIPHIRFPPDWYAFSTAP
jgi:hypothetical protein